MGCAKPFLVPSTVLCSPAFGLGTSLAWLLHFPCRGTVPSHDHPADQAVQALLQKRVDLLSRAVTA